MKIWFEILTPKQVLFFGPMIKKLAKKHKILCTSRHYREVDELANVLGLKLTYVESYTGITKADKLNVSIRRMKKLTDLVLKFSPDLVISYCSADASRVAFGLGLKHIAFTDIPSATIPLKLSLSLVDRLLTPWIIPKKSFTKFGIPAKHIIQYKAIDAAPIIKNAIKIKSSLSFPKKKTILFRTYETHASYATTQGVTRMYKMLEAIVNANKDWNILVLTRYVDQLQELKNKFGNKIIILDRVIPSQELLPLIDVYVGSGGTMTAESAFRGIPNISYNSNQNVIGDYLINKKLTHLITDPKKLIPKISKLLESDNKKFKKRAKDMLNSMEDPYQSLIKVMKSINNS